jgi:nucleoside-diphosphate-sugar epimerase
MNLITGATGTIGAHVALKLLLNNKSVTCTKRANSDINRTKKLFSYYTHDFENLFQRIKWIDADVCDIYSLLDAFDGVEVVYHCAGFVTFDKSKETELFKINVVGTANVVNACIEKKVSALCHVSSIAAINNPDIVSNISETVYWKSSPNIGNYAISKYNGEREVWRGIEEGLNAVIVNPGIVLAPGFWNQSSGKLFTACSKGMLFYTSGKCAFVDAEDVAICMIELVDKKQYNNRFILSEGNYTFKEVLSKIHIEFKQPPPRFLATKYLLFAVSFLESMFRMFVKKEAMLSMEGARSSMTTNTYSNQKIKSIIHFSFKPIDSSIAFICNCFNKEKVK